VYGDVRLSGCTLKGCRLVRSDDPGLSLVVRNVVLDRCRMEGCVAQGVYFEDVTVDGLRLSRPHLLSGCVFRHVTLRGKIGPVMAIPPNPMSPLRLEFTAGIVEKYKEVDWALDISEAVFSDADFFCVPGDLIRRFRDTASGGQFVSGYGSGGRSVWAGILRSPLRKRWKVLYTAPSCAVCLGTLRAKDRRGSCVITSAVRPAA
jgi:hypothetical protein